MKYLLRRSIQPSRGWFRSQSLAAETRRAIKRHGVPKAVAAIPDGGLDTKGAGAFIRSMGSTRRVFLRNAYLKNEEIEGLAFRIRALTKNAGISSVLIATGTRAESEMLAVPAMVEDYLKSGPEAEIDSLFPPELDKTFHVSGGYDPMMVYKSKKHRDREYLDSLLKNLTSLAGACKGSNLSKVPTICLPHGAVTDGGFAFLLSSYVLSTRESCFRILNPSRGLSFDPVGLSYYLPRLGQEFKQESRNYVGCGLILGLMGYEANQADMLEVGLSTHRLDTPDILGQLENTLSNLRPWGAQGVLKYPVRDYGQPKPTQDINHQFRNAAVADTIECFTEDCIYGPDHMNRRDPELEWILEDPSFYNEYTPWAEDRNSDLLNFAATFDEIFQQNSDLVGILESLREVSQRQTSDPEEQEGIDVAKDFVRRLESQSPLALSVVFRLLKMSADNFRKETLGSCATRERRAQINMFAQDDFASWAAATRANKPVQWKHKRIADVTYDEVMEIIGQDDPN